VQMAGEGVSHRIDREAHQGLSGPRIETGNESWRSAARDSAADHGQARYAAVRNHPCLSGSADEDCNERNSFDPDGESTQWAM